MSDILVDATFDVRDMLSEAYATAKRACMDRRQRLVLTVPRSPVWVDGDFARLRQVIEDLLESASKHTETGGRIELSLKEVSGWAAIMVTHSGIAFTPGKIAKFFKSPSQVHGFPTGERLRLNRVRRCVDLHGGSIEAGGKGPRRRAHFTVRLPLAAQEGQVQPRRRE